MARNCIAGQDAAIYGLRFRVYGGFSSGVQGSGFRIQGLGFRV